MGQDMSADAALIILGGHTDSQICQALQNRPQVRARLQSWGPPPLLQPQHSTRQHSNASAQQAPWPDGDRPAFSDPIQSQAQFGGAPPQQAQTQQQAQQAPQHWGQQGGAGSNRNWHDMTEQEHRSQAPEPYFDWDAGTHMPGSSQQDTWANWDSAPSTGGKGKSQQAQRQPRAQQAMQSHTQGQQQSQWGSSWQQQGKGKGSWDPFAGNEDWTAYNTQPAQQQQQASQGTAPSSGTSLQPSVRIPASELKWAGDRPYHQNPRTGEWLCALACTNTYCKFGRPACNFKPKGRILDDRRSPRSCSHCLAKGAGK